MPWTNAWDETAPLGSAFASTIDDIVRQLKLDLRERLDAQHYFGHSTTHDGKHRNILGDVNTLANNLAYLDFTGGQLTGSAANPLVNLDATWNTSGITDAIKLNISTDTAHGAGSTLLNLYLGSVSKFRVAPNGDAHIHGISYAWPAGGGSANTFLKNDGANNLSWFAASLAGITAVKVANYNAVFNDFVPCNGTFNVNLPTVVGNASGIIDVKNIGTGTITVVPSGVETIDGAANFVLSSQYQSVTLISDGTSAWYVR